MNRERHNKPFHPPADPTYAAAQASGQCPRIRPYETDMMNPQPPLLPNHSQLRETCDHRNLLVRDEYVRDRPINARGFSDWWNKTARRFQNPLLRNCIFTAMHLPKTTCRLAGGSLHDHTILPEAGKKFRTGVT